MATPLFGPTDRNPDYARNEHQYVRISGAQTVVVVASGGGMVHGVTVGVAGTLLKLYDVATGGTTDDTTEIATLVLTTIDAGAFVQLDVAFSKGLTAIVTGAADLTVYFRGVLIKSGRFYGTQLDGNDARGAAGTSTDKAMAS